MNKNHLPGSAMAVLLGVFVFAAAALAGAPVVNVHANFTSDPYDDNWCGIDGIGVDRVVARYKEDASGASLETVNITELFTATESGKSMEIRSTGARRVSAPIATATAPTRSSRPTPVCRFLPVRSGGSVHRFAEGAPDDPPRSEPQRLHVD